MNRWRTCCHEAAHCVAAVRLGGTCDGLVVFPDGGGLAGVDQLLGSSVAFMYAAGCAGERLVEEFAPPEMVTALPAGPLSPDEIEKLPVYATSPHIALDLGRKADDRKAGVDDCVAIAEWAIAGFWDRPERWAQRVAFAHQVAGRIVEENVAAIVAVARELFVKGSLSASEINQLMGAV